MRTKTLLLTAALCAVGVVTSVAQTPVYSVNAVGYVNVTLVPGYNLIANPLNGTNNLINTIIPIAPDDTEVVGWNSAIQQFGGNDVYVSSLGWVDSSFATSTRVVNPGTSFFVRNTGQANISLTFVGEVPQGSLTNNITPNYGFYSSIVPQSSGFSTMGFPQVPDMEYTVWNASAQQYGATYTFIGVQPGYPSGWADSSFASVDPTPSVAQGFIIRNPNPTTYSWGRTFSVNN